MNDPAKGACKDDGHQGAVDKVLLLLLLCVAVLPAVLQRTSDFALYHHAARNWAHIYTPSVPLFVYMPWSLIIVLPLSLLPVRIAFALFSLVTVGATGVLLKRMCSDGLARAAAMARIPFAVMLSLRQWDGLGVAAALVGEWALQMDRPVVLGLAFTLTLAKPNTAIPAILVIPLWLWRRPMRFRLRAIVSMAAVVLLSFTIWGWWIPGYLGFLRVGSPVVVEELVTANRTYPASLALSPYVRAGFVVAWLVVLWRLRHQPARVMIAFALVFGTLVWLYANLYNYASTGPAIAWLCCENRRFGLVAALAELVTIVALLVGGPA